MPKIIPAYLTIIIIFSISILFVKGQVVFSQENTQEASNTFPLIDSSADEEGGFEDEFEDEFADSGQEVFDPLSGYNRVMTGFNDGFYFCVLDLQLLHKYQLALHIQDLVLAIYIKIFYHHLLL